MRELLGWLVGSVGMIPGIIQEGKGSRGLFYENFGSAITPLLLPLADVLESTEDKPVAFEVCVEDEILLMGLSD